MNIPPSTLDNQSFQNFLTQEYPEPTKMINLGSQYQRPILVNYLQWGIQHINVSLHQIKNEGMQILIQSQLARPRWPLLKQLDAVKNDISSEGLQGLDQLKWTELNTINLRQNKIDHRGPQIFLKANFINLKILLIGTNQIGPVGCQWLSHTDWPLFEYLDVNFNKIDNDGLAHLTTAHWPNLKNINLANNRLDAQSTYYLQAADWPQLQSLQLSRNYIGKINSSELTDLGCWRIGHMKTNRLKYFGFCKTDIIAVGNEVSLNGIRMILRSPIFVQGCVLCINGGDLELTKNQFRFDEIRGYLKQYRLFCDQFQD